jgi:hypothetical protein
MRRPPPQLRIVNLEAIYAFERHLEGFKLGHKRSELSERLPTLAQGVDDGRDQPKRGDEIAD